MTASGSPGEHVRTDAEHLVDFLARAGVECVSASESRARTTCRAAGHQGPSRPVQTDLPEDIALVAVDDDDAAP